MAPVFRNFMDSNLLYFLLYSDSVNKEKIHKQYILFINRIDSILLARLELEELEH